MSDQDVVHALDAIERLFQAEELDFEALGACQGSLEATLATAERGNGWAEIAIRAHRLRDQMDIAVVALSERRDALKQELGLQAQGARALKGYRPF